MSVFDTAVTGCPACGTDCEFELVLSVNADRRPELRQEILDGTFQALPCPNCGARMRLPPEFSYLELRRGHFIGVFPAPAITAWREHEQAVLEAFAQSFGANAPPAARALGAGLTPRLVFGWPALQEKLLARDLELEDDILELLKLALLERVQGLTISFDSELRLAGGDAERLSLDWLRAETGEVASNFVVPRAAYTAIAGELETWAPLRARIVGPAFVDLRRAALSEAEAGVA
jgi:hypothetical protein